MGTIFFNFVMVIGALGSFTAAVIALLKAAKVASTVQFKTERLYGDDADKRYKQLMKADPEKFIEVTGPDEYKGGSSKITPQFEVERFHYDELSMTDDLKKCTKTYRYFYESGGKTFVKCWRI